MHSFLALLRTLSQRRRKQFLVLAGTLALSALAELAKIGLVIPVLALAAAPERTAPALLLRLSAALGTEPVYVASLLLILAALVAVATRLALVWLTHRFVTGVGQDISDRIFARLLRQPYEAYKIRSSGEILSGLEKVRVVIFYVLMPAMQGMTAAVVSLTIVGLLLALDPGTAAIGAASMTTVYLIARLITRRRLHANSETIAEAATVKTIIVQEALGNIRDILIDRSQTVFEAKFRAVDARLRRAQSVNSLIAAGPRAFIESAIVVALVAIALLVSGRPGGIGGALPILGAVALGAQRLLPLLQQIYGGWAHIAGNFQAVDDVLELMRMPVQPEPDEAAGGEEGAPAGDIRLQNVGFSFPGAGAGPVLSGIDLSIPRGARVGIVGESGSGKSTLVDLIMGLLAPTSGTISIGGRTVDGPLRARWQSQIAHVPQSVYLSDASIASNIAFGVAEKEIDMTRVEAAAARARAAAFIARLPDGYATRVGEGGARLSGGERQRIGVARALYKQAAVLILDEATSALDEATEAALLRSLDTLPVTLIMVSHRSAFLAGCDLIVRMAEGRATVEPGASGGADPAFSSAARPA